MTLKPQDIVILLKLVAIGPRSWTYVSLAVDLGVSPSQVHAAVRRAVAAQLALRTYDGVVPNVRNLEEFLVHGLKYVFAPERGSLTRGIPTGYAAPPLRGHFVSSDEPLPVWPDPEGGVRGISFSPLFKTAPFAAQKDAVLYELLALVDALRGGRARERDIAIKELRLRLERYAKNS